jgi:hypothetical protein
VTVVEEEEMWRRVGPEREEIRSAANELNLKEKLLASNE